MAGRTLILSDTHLGRPHSTAGSADALRPLWQGCDHLILNGDVAELHLEGHQGQATEQLFRLQELCELDGVRLTLLAGNHDPFLTDDRHLFLADGSVLVTHGDALHRSVAPWAHVRHVIRPTFERALAKPRAANQSRLEFELEAAALASQVGIFAYERQHGEGQLRSYFKRPWAFAAIVWYWHRIPALARAFVDRCAPGVRYLIIGHTHRQGIWRRGGLTIINTGCYGLPGRPRAVVIEGNTLRVHRVRMGTPLHQLEARPLATFPLTVADAPQALPATA